MMIMSSLVIVQFSFSCMMIMSSLVIVQFSFLPFISLSPTLFYAMSMKKNHKSP